MQQLISQIKLIVKYVLATLTLPLLRPGVTAVPGFFEKWQERGVHVLPVHFYSCVPNTRELAANYPGSTSLAGIDMADEKQIELLKNAIGIYQDETQAFLVKPGASDEEIDVPDKFILPNIWFSGHDPHIYYGIIRHFKPNKIIEIGSGHSTKVARMAVDKNGHGNITSVEPYPREFLRQIPSVKLIEAPVQDVDVALLTDLEASDILFIDSTHTVRSGGDVTYLFLEVLPLLKPGVIVHVHDIFLPDPYPKEWTLDRHLFWTEQFLLQAYLVGNTNVKVLFANYYMAKKYETELKECLPYALGLTGGSFWFQVQ